MNLHLVLFFSFLSVIDWSHGQDLVDEEEIVLRHVQPLGDWSVVNPEQGDVQEAARKAVEKFNMKSKARKYFKLVEVSSAQTKVTNVLNYKINATIGRTMCLKTEPGDLNTCDMTKKRLRCKFDVQFDPRNEEHTVNMSCNK